MGQRLPKKICQNAKGKNNLEKAKKWAKKKRETDPEYLKNGKKIEQHISKRNKPIT